MSYESLLENPGATFLTYFISLLITLVVYGAYPLLYAILQKEPITPKRYKWVCYGVNFFLFIFIMFGILQGTSAWPYIFWTAVFISVGRKILRDKGLLIDSKENAQEEASASQPDIPAQIPDTFEPVAQITPVEPTIPNEHPRTFSSKGAVIALSVMCALLLIVASVSIFHSYQQQQSIIQLNEQVTQLLEELDLTNQTLSRTEANLSASRSIAQDLQAKLSDKNTEISELSEDLQFFNKYVVFVPDDNTRIYHKYDCPKRTAKSTSFWAYNVEAAKSTGYKPCEECCPSTNDYFDYLKEKYGLD